MIKVHIFIPLALACLLVQFHNINASTWLSKNSWLCWAAQNNSARLAEFLLAHGADPSAVDYPTTSPFTAGFTPLHWAAYNGNSAMIKLLLRAGANIDARDSNDQGCNTIDHALHQQHHKCAQLLIQAAYETYETHLVQDYLSRALPRAVRRGNSEIVQLLLQSGASPNYNQPKCKPTALYAACKKGKPELVAQLLAAGANPNAQSYRHNETALFAVMSCYNDDTAEIIKSLLAAGIDITAKGSHGLTVAYLINDKTPAHIIQLLLKAGLDPNEITDKTYETTPLRSMLAYGRRENSLAIAEILQRGALLHPQWATRLNPEERERLGNHPQQIVHRAEAIRDFCDDASESDFPADLFGVMEQFTGVPIIEKKAKTCAAFADT